MSPETVGRVSRAERAAPSVLRGPPYELPELLCSRAFAERQARDWVAAVRRALDDPSSSLAAVEWAKYEARRHLEALLRHPAPRRLPT